MVSLSMLRYLDIIAAATEVKVFPRPILSATSAPDISESQTHLLPMINMAQTWYGRNFCLGRPGIEYLWPGTWSSIDWRIGWAFSSLTASSKLSCSKLLLIVLRTVFNTELVFHGSRSSSPFHCYWTSLAPWLVIFSSSMVSFSSSKVLLAIHLLLNLSGTLVGLLFVLNGLFQLLRREVGWWAHTLALLKFIVLLGISQPSIWTQ